MEKEEILGILSLISFLLILFTPIKSDIWKYPLISGVIFGFIWFIKK